LNLTIESRSGPASASVMIRRRVRGHTRLVHVFRWMLPAVMLALLGVLGAFVFGEAVRSAAARPKESSTQIRMINPHFVGRDDHGREFNLSARQATRDDVDMQRVLLLAPVMMLDVGTPNLKTLTSDRGVYEENTRLLRLYGHVRVNDTVASSLATDEALVDTKAGTVSGASAVAAASPNGDVQAGHYTASEKGGHVVLTGGVHAVLKGR
jgi:lipopolysaccharide export system protein LptC